MEKSRYVSIDCVNTLNVKDNINIPYPFLQLAPSGIEYSQILNHSGFRQWLERTVNVIHVFKCHGFQAVY